MKKDEMTMEEKCLVHDWQNENAVCRNAADEAECFLRWVRAAVAEQREKDANTNPAGIACPKRNCREEKGFPCISNETGLMAPCHPERWQAAIRAGKPEE